MLAQVDLMKISIYMFCFVSSHNIQSMNTIIFYMTGYMLELALFSLLKYNVHPQRSNRDI